MSATSANRLGRVSSSSPAATPKIELYLPQVDPPAVHVPPSLLETAPVLFTNDNTTLNLRPPLRENWGRCTGVRAELELRLSFEHGGELRDRLYFSTYVTRRLDLGAFRLVLALVNGGQQPK